MITIAGFEAFQTQVMTASGSFLLDFWGPNCAPYLDLNRTLEALEDEYKGRLTFVKINADDELDIASRMGVRGLPTLVLMHDGQIITRWIGALSASALKSKVEEALTSLRV